MQYIYLHGFASSPSSTKAQVFQSYFANLGIELEIPDLNGEDFSQLTITGQIQQVVKLFKGNQSQQKTTQQIKTGVTLIGSSLGGWVSVLLAEKYPQVQRLILLAPAFYFLSHWLPRLGDSKLQRWQQEKYLQVYHYGEKRELPLSFDFVADALQYQQVLLQRSLPTLIWHGINDDVIPISASRDFLKSHPWVNLTEANSDHSLIDVMPEICFSTKNFVSCN